MHRTTTTLLLAVLIASLGGCQSRDDGEGTATGTDTGDSDADSGVTTSATGETGTPACDAPDPAFEGNASIVVEPLSNGEGETEFITDCTVDVLTVDPTLVHVELGCGERSATVEVKVSSGFTPLFAQGDTVILDYHETNPFWANQWFALRAKTEGAGLLLGGVQADELFPPGVDDMFAPLVMKEAPGVCAVPVGCDDPFQRLALAVSYDQDTQQIVPDHSALVGSLTSIRVDLGTAFRYIDNDCDFADVPPTWFSAVFIRLPEG